MLTHTGFSVSSPHLSLAVVIWALCCPSAFGIQTWKTETCKVSRLMRRTIPTMLQAGWEAAPFAQRCLCSKGPGQACRQDIGIP